MKTEHFIQHSKYLLCIRNALRTKEQTFDQYFRRCMQCNIIGLPTLLGYPKDFGI